MKYIAYIRKSSEDKKRQIQSIPKQYKWCEKEIERRNIKIVKFFEDSRSAHKLHRQSFKEMIEFIEQSTEPIGIITWKISRLARNPIDEGVIKYAFMRKKIKHIIARDREYKEHESQIIMGVDFGQATQASIELSKDVKEGMNKKISGGERPTKAPYGYINDPIGLKGEKKVFIDEKYFKPIQKFLKAYSTGIYTVPELRDKLTAKGVFTRNGKPFSLSTLYLILKRRFYTGEYLWNGKIEQGNHKPMISLEEFEKIQSLMNKKHKPSQNKYQNYYSGFITCNHCLSAITGYSKTKNNKKRGVSIYHYLKCGKRKDKSCPQIQLTREQMDKQIVLILQSLTISVKIIEFVLKKIEREVRKEQSTISQDLGKLQREFNALDGEIEVLGRKLIQGVVNDEMFRKMNLKLEKEQQLITKKVERLKSNNLNELEKLKQVFSFLNSAPQKFVKGSYELKKLILKTIGSNFFLNNGKVSIEVGKVFSIIQKAKEFYTPENKRFEPSFTRIKTGLKPILSDKNLVWSAWREGLRTFLLESDFIIPTL